MESIVIPLGEIKEGQTLFAYEVENPTPTEPDNDWVAPTMVQITPQVGNLFKEGDCSVTEVTEFVKSNEDVRRILANSFMQGAAPTQCIFHEPMPITEGDGFSVTIVIEMIPVGSRRTLN